ncbi:MAG TPA: hypothetical protein VF034_04340 [Gemmatimonadaceae bacterium]
MIARIRMTFLAAAVVLVAAPAVHAQQQKMTEDDAILRNYVLTMPKVEAWANATLEYTAAIKAKPLDERKKMEVEKDAQDAETLTQTAAALERIPEVRRAFRKAGMTTKEALTISLVLFQSVMYDQMSAQYPDAKIPYNMNPANLAFVRKNKAQLETRLKAVQEATKEASAEAKSDEPTDPDDPSPDEP